MVAYMTGYEPEAFLARYPDKTPEEIEEMNREHARFKDPRGCPYGVADRMSLQDGAEWSLLAILACITPYGHCDMKEWQNPEGGYEDDVFYTRADNQMEIGPPTFVFKPSGYAMGWYKYYWRSPEQSENLSIGEIRKIFRLCIEHILYKREIPKGTTREILALPIHTTEVPDDIRERVDRVCRMANCNMMQSDSTMFSPSIARGFTDHDRADNEAARLIESIEGAEWTADWIGRHPAPPEHEPVVDEVDDVLRGMVR